MSARGQARTRRTAPRQRRARGRPARRALDESRILESALELLEAEGLAGVTMRALARRLGVDPMALYHYHADRDALLAAAAARAYRELDARIGERLSRSTSASDVEDVLATLGLAYLELLATSGELVRYLATHGEAALEPTRVFGARVHAALAPLGLSSVLSATVHDVFVDFVHGFAIGLPRTGPTPAHRRRFRAELTILCAGITAAGRRRV